MFVGVSVQGVSVFAQGFFPGWLLVFLSRVFVGVSVQGVFLPRVFVGVFVQGVCRCFCRKRDSNTGSSAPKVGTLTTRLARRWGTVNQTVVLLTVKGAGIASW